MRITLIILASLAALVAVVVLWGWMLPQGHVATRVLRLDRTPVEVWAAITDFQGQAAWRSDIQSVEKVPGAATETWKEVGRNGGMPLATTEIDPPRRLVRTIADPSLPFGGRWIYEVAAEGSGSTLTITEDGQVYNPIFRFVSHYFMNQAGTIETVMRDLAKHFGEAPRISATSPGAD